MSKADPDSRDRGSASLQDVVVHVPYRGAGPALNDLVAGQVQFGTVVVTGGVLELHREKNCI